MSSVNQFLEAFVDGEGHFKWPNQGDYADLNVTLRTDANIGDLVVSVSAGINYFDEPVVGFRNADGANESDPTFDVVVTSRIPVDQFFEVDAELNGFVRPVPEPTGLSIQVEDGFGLRRYIVEDDTNAPVTMQRYNSQREDPGYDTEPVAVNAEDEAVIRALASGLLASLQDLKPVHQPMGTSH